MTSLLNERNLLIRPAEERDYEWVAELMANTLAPFYDGDHRAHAYRIFETHIKGGVDYVGHFSTEQHMFIAEYDAEQVGLIHLVVKKQETVKISPLIVDPKFRAQLGIGSKLLAYAEDFARIHGARQLYCTVASINHPALEFFIKKGFRVTGTARRHYKPEHDEHMLYKQLIEDQGYDAPNVSVVNFDYSRHAESVRELILNTLSSNFLGVDDAWVDALFTGYSRRNSADINTKYKIIYVAETDGHVTGVVGATPKKGDPIKLMPLVAANEAAFEALIIDLQGLLMDYGHKLYVHLVPEAWQVACMQRHGWAIEGVFPGGYAPNSVVQQWGTFLKNGGETMRTMRIKRPYYDAILSGKKTLEVRVGYDSIRRYKVGDLIKLETSQVSRVVRIKAIRNYATFASMIDQEEPSKIVPNEVDKGKVLRLLKEIYPPHKEALGVYVFEIELSS